MSCREEKTLSDQPSIIVIDDFHADPHQIRREALKLAFGRSKSRGHGFNGRLAKASRRAKRDLMDRLATIVAAEIDYDLDLNGDFKSLTRAQFRRKKSFVHYDLWDWSAVVNLSPERAVRGFTTFWYHRALGLHGLHDLEAAARTCRRLGCALADVASRVDRDSRSARCWQPTSRVEHAFNRLILFRGNMFHSASEGFGENVATSKLTQTFFFDTRGER
jgi:hypothetical protein